MKIILGENELTIDAYKLYSGTRIRIASEFEKAEVVLDVDETLQAIKALKVSLAEMRKDDDG